MQIFPFWFHNPKKMLNQCILHSTVVFSPINPVSNLHSCTLKNSDDRAGKSKNLLAIKPPFFFFSTKTTWPSNSAPSLSHPTSTERERGRSNSKLSGRALLPALHQETQCERAARHHTDAPLKIHVYHSSSFIDGLSSLYVYEVRGVPVTLVSDPPGSTVVPNKLPVPF